MTLGQRQERFAEDLAKLIQFAISKGYGVRIGEVERTAEQQKLYVQTGRSKTMNSNHLVKCAADLHFTKDGVLCYPPEIGHYWELLDPKNSAGMFWAKFKDAPHLERRP
mgnify:CR=1 FL=1